jgi:hypothetical protein
MQRVSTARAKAMLESKSSYIRKLSASNRRYSEDYQSIESRTLQTQRQNFNQQWKNGMKRTPRMAVLAFLDRLKKRLQELAAVWDKFWAVYDAETALMGQVARGLEGYSCFIEEVTFKDKEIRRKIATPEVLDKFDANRAAYKS